MSTTSGRRPRGRVQTGWGEAGGRGRSLGVDSRSAHGASTRPSTVAAHAENAPLQCGPPVFKRPQQRARPAAEDAAGAQKRGSGPEVETHVAGNELLLPAALRSVDAGRNGPVVETQVAGGELLFPAALRSVDAGRGRGRGRGRRSAPGIARTRGAAPSTEHADADAGAGVGTDPYLHVEEGGGEDGASFSWEDLTSGPPGGGLSRVGNAEQDRLSLEAEVSLQQLLNLTSSAPPPEADGRRGASAPPVILWFRQDLRLHDNPALVAAAQSGRPVIPVYLHVPAEDGKWPVCGAAKYWLHHALLHLSQALESRLGSKLLICCGESSLDLLLTLIMDSGMHARLVCV